MTKEPLVLCRQDSETGDDQPLRFFSNNPILT
jgi:hypothetical protein